jgi:hypothetical protein
VLQFFFLTVPMSMSVVRSRRRGWRWWHRCTSKRACTSASMTTCRSAVRMSNHMMRWEWRDIWHRCWSVFTRRFMIGCDRWSRWCRMNRRKLCTWSTWARCRWWWWCAWKNSKSVLRACKHVS